VIIDICEGQSRDSWKIKDGNIAVAIAKKETKEEEILYTLQMIMEAMLSTCNDTHIAYEEMFE
jgi:hypothetical protein